MQDSWLVTATMVALIGVGLFPRRTVSSPLVDAFRVFFPSWRFFGDPGLHVNLRVRAIDTDGIPGRWKSALTEASRGPLTLVWNPASTRRWAEASVVRELLERTEAEGIQELPELEELDCFHMVDRMARAALASSEDGTPYAGVYEFEVRSMALGEEEMTSHLSVPPRAVDTPATRADADTHRLHKEREQR